MQKTISDQVDSWINSLKWLRAQNKCLSSGHNDQPNWKWSDAITYLYKVTYIVYQKLTMFDRGIILEHFYNSQSVHYIEVPLHTYSRWVNEKNYNTKNWNSWPANLFVPIIAPHVRKGTVIKFVCHPHS